MLRISPTSKHSKRSGLKRKFIWVQALIFALSLVLFFYLLYSIGFEKIWGTVTQVGWGFLVIIFINGVNHLVRAFALFLAIPSNERKIPFFAILGARLAGEAVSSTTFTGPLLGDAAKVGILNRYLPLERSASAVIIDDILYYITVAFVILSGVGLLITTARGGANAVGNGIYAVAASVLVLLGLLAWGVYLRVRPVTFVFKRLDPRGLLPEFLSKQRPRIRETESHVLDVYYERPATFVSLLGLGAVTHLLGVAEVYAGLYLLGYPPGFINAYVIETVAKMVNFVFSFIPGTVGVYEGGNGMVLRLLGFTTAIGVALALVRRGAMLFWTLVGFLILLLKTANDGKKELAKEPAAGKA